MPRTPRFPAPDKESFPEFRKDAHKTLRLGKDAAALKLNPAWQALEALLRESEQTHAEAALRGSYDGDKEIAQREAAASYAIRGLLSGLDRLVEAGIDAANGLKEAGEEVVA